MDLKICPTCKTMVFADMDTCYGCMYRFGSDPVREEAVRRELEDSAFPESEEVQQEGEGGQGTFSLLETERAEPWPPPIEAECCVLKSADGEKGVANEVGTQALEAGARSTAAVFNVPAMTVSIRAEDLLPAGVTLQINVEPPRGEAALAGG